MKKISYLKYHRDKDYLQNESLFRNIFRKRFNIISRFSPNPGVVSDIGCSNGVMLDIFAEKGWKTWGVDPSENAKIANQKGHKIIKNFFEKAKLSGNFFDLVILNHTLEHMDNPVKVLGKVRSLLKQNGIVYIDVPNAAGLGAKILGKHWPYLLPDEHKHQFTKLSLTSLLTKAGFKVIHWESRSGLFEFANPFLELWQSFIGLKKRFFINLVTIPYSLVASALNMGDSMSFVANKK